MSSPTPQDDRCNATTRDGDHCENHPVTGADRCRMHGGTNEGAPDPGANRETHGLTADRERWFSRHRDEVEPLARELIASYVDDAPFDWDDAAKVDQLAAVVIDQVRLRQSNQHLGEFVIEETVGVADDGTEITKLKENPAHLPRDRIKRTNVRVLKELGVLGDDGDQSTDGQTITEIFADDSVE